MQHRFLVLLGLLFIISTGSLAQDSSLVQWQARSAKTGNGYTITFLGTIKKGWHMYTKADQDGLSGIVLETNDPYAKPATPAVVSPTSNIQDAIFESDKQVALDSIRLTTEVTGDSIPPAIKMVIRYEVADAGNFIPEEKSIIVNLEEGVVPVTQNRILIGSIQKNAPLSNCKTSSQEGEESAGLLVIFSLGFLGGIVALITPCVFPMIPLTVSFFTKRSNSRKTGLKNAFLYGFFIFLIYVLLSIPFHFLDNIAPEILNNISTNVYLNVFFFVIFIVFALSFFGLYEITLPGNLSNSVDSKASVTTVAGIFFMALTLALVSFSCTGPILGSLLAGSLTADGGAMQLTAGMAGFGLSLALPFALFAMFPQWLNALPKSGGWLTTVKVVLGFVELALAFKFLSNADLVKHWGLLKREIFLGIWILVGTGLTLYLFNVIRFSHDSPVKKLPAVRIILGVLVGAFTLYLLPGVTNTKWANLKLISGFPPPLYYSIYQKESECVLGLNCTRDYEEGLKMAREQNKPILLDFTGYACVNCRRMEEKVWTKSDVYQVLKDKYIIISLYVDDKKELPANEQFIYTTKNGQQKEIVTVGDKWATFETENFQNNAQPYYAIINNQEQLLSQPAGYVPDAKDYLQWLQCGVATFEKK